MREMYELESRNENPFRKPFQTLYIFIRDVNNVTFASS